jgi:hypothetical protein
MAARVTLKAINGELARQSNQRRIGPARTPRPSGEGERVLLLLRRRRYGLTVRVTPVNALTLDKWIEEFKRLKKLNQQISGIGKAGGKAARHRKTEPLRRANPTL